MGRNFRKDKSEQKEIAKERIDKLFLQAEKTKDNALARRYVEMARRMVMKFKVRMKPEYKRRFCRHCGSYFIQGKNLTVRLKNQKVIYHCLECKEYTRYPYVREIKAKRQARLKKKTQ